MKEFDAITMSGTVIATNRGSATVELSNGSVVRGIIAGRLMKNRIKVVTGDRVQIEISPYDLTKGRIVYRSKGRSTVIFSVTRVTGGAPSKS